jgi:beta-glucosidase
MKKKRKWLRLILTLLTASAIAYTGACIYYNLRFPLTTFDEGAEKTPFTGVPKDFLLGTATSAHQIEGGNTLNDWATFEAESGHIKNDERCGRACDSWSLVDDDIRLMKELGANSYRFSIEWSRLEPSEGAFDEAAWSHYAEQIKKLTAQHMTPMVTLLHFSLPQWLASKGGLTAEDFPEKFARFVAEAARRYGPDVDLWCTLNEPNVMMYEGYVIGAYPPGKKSNEEASKAFAGLVRAHALAATALRRNDPGCQIGVAMNLIAFQPRQRYNLLDWISKDIAESSFDWAFYDSITSGKISLSAPGFPSLNTPLEGLQGSVDFFGVNYYRRDLVHFSPFSLGMVETKGGPNPHSDLDWEIYPEGLYDLLKATHLRYQLPIYVTENGMADSSGEHRADYLRRHMYAVVKAIHAGVDVRGYYHWSLMDNFEWAEGFSPRFGLYKMDYTTMARTPSPGVASFQEIAKEMAAQ